MPLFSNPLQRGQYYTCKENNTARINSVLIGFGRCCSFLINLIQARVLWEEKPQLRRSTPPDCLQVRMQTLVIDLEETSSWQTVPTPEHVVQACMRKQIYQAMRTNPVSRIPPWLPHKFLPLGSSPDFLYDGS